MPLRILTVLMMFLVLACSEYKKTAIPESATTNIRLSFSIMHDQQIVKCNQSTQSLSFQAISNTNHLIDIESFAFYLHDVHLFANSTQAEIELSMQPSSWQTDDIALIAFDAACNSQASSAELNANTELHLTTQNEAFKHLVKRHAKSSDDLELRFTLGIPFESNHVNPLTQTSPLNISSMFWSWRNGYKFMRLDMKSSHEVSHQGMSLHLGSVGCQSASHVRAPKQACEQSNLVDVRIPIKLNEFASQHSKVTIPINFDLSTLLRSVPFSQQNSCMFLGLSQQEVCTQFINTLSSQPVFVSQVNDLNMQQGQP